MKETLQTTEIKIQHQLILKMLLYFDIFQYPLSRNELSKTLGEIEDLDDVLEDLQALGLIDRSADWYFLSGKNYSKRINESSNSEYAFRKAQKYARRINGFPFVRGVYISGSLSKDWADETTDVDYFIITEPQRLWLCRTLLILYKKVFLLNSRKYFCLNYFIDTSHLEIEEKNVFTATEISFLTPLVNPNLLETFVGKNNWIKKYYPNFSFDLSKVISTRETLLKRISEKLLKGRLGEMLDIWSMKRTLSYWRKKFPDQSLEEFQINFKSSRTISKHHPNGFQKKVLDELGNRLLEFESRTSIRLR